MDSTPTAQTATGTAGTTATVYDVGGEILNAHSYKVDIAKRGRSYCRGQWCVQHKRKIHMGELRLGISQLFGNNTYTYCYKHWRCISQYEFRTAIESMERGELEGLEDLPKAYKAVVLNSFESGQPWKFDVPTHARDETDGFRDLDAESIAEVRKTIAECTPKTKPKRY